MFESGNFETGHPLIADKQTADGQGEEAMGQAVENLCVIDGLELGMDELLGKVTQRILADVSR